LSSTSVSAADSNDVLRRLQEVDSQLMPTDGVRYFNMLYIEVAREIAAAESQFADPAALKHLEVEFLEFYLAAIRAGETAARCWRPLFQRRLVRKILPLQFALAGMNAHINHDLPIALAQTWITLGIDPFEAAAFRHDYELINGLLAEVEQRMRPRFIPDEFQRIEEAMEELGDILAIWNIRAAREAAWANGVVQWKLARIDFPPFSRLPSVHPIDGLCGLASRALLKRIDW